MMIHALLGFKLLMLIFKEDGFKNGVSNTLGSWTIRCLNSLVVHKAMNVAGIKEKNTYNPCESIFFCNYHFQYFIVHIFFFFTSFFEFFFIYSCTSSEKYFIKQSMKNKHLKYKKYGNIWQQISKYLLT